MSREHEAQREDVAVAERAAGAAAQRSLMASRYPALAQALGDRGGRGGGVAAAVAAAAASRRSTTRPPRPFAF
jgi:hypothetical protein